MDNNSKDSIYNYDELDLQELFTALYNKLTTILFITLGFIILSLLYAYTAPIKFKSTSVSIPADSSATSMPQASSGLAAIAGFNLKGNSSPVPKLVASLQSRDFLNHLLEFDGVYENLVAFKKYDTNSKTSIFNEKIFNSDTGEWVQGNKPSKYKAYLSYRNKFSVTNPKLTNFINLEMKHGSPTFAKNFLNLVIQEINEISRQQDLNQSSEALDYLYGQLESVQQSDVQVAISQIIESQLKKQMLANVTTNYALKIIDSPYEAELKSSPNRKNILLAGTFMGFLIGIFFVLSQHYFKKHLSKVAIKKVRN